MTSFLLGKRLKEAIEKNKKCSLELLNCVKRSSEKIQKQDEERKVDREKASYRPIHIFSK